MKKNILYGSFLISIAAILWGLDGVVLTPRLYNLDLSYVVFMLHLIPFAIMNIFLFKEYKEIKSFSKYDVLIILLIAIFGGVLGTFSIVKALFLTNFEALTIVVLLQKLQPLFAILLAFFLLKEKLGKNFLIFAFLALIASYILTFEFNLPSFNASKNMILASGFSLLAAFSFGSSTVFGKILLKKYRSRTVLFYRYGLTSLIAFFIVLLNGKLNQLFLTTPLNWKIFFLIAFTTGSSAIFLYYHGLKRVTAHISTICELFFPISAVLFDYLINGNRLSLIQWISGFVLIAVIMKISYNHSLEEFHIQ